MAKVLTGDGIRAIELPVGGDVLVSGFLARPWTTSSGEVRLVAAGVLALVLVPQMIVSLVRLATAAANPDLRRRFAADAAGVSIDVHVNVDVAITVGRCVIVGLKRLHKSAIVKRAASHRWAILVILSVVRRRFHRKYTRATVCSTR